MIVPRVQYFFDLSYTALAEIQNEIADACKLANNYCRTSMLQMTNAMIGSFSFTPTHHNKCKITMISNYSLYALFNNIFELNPNSFKEFKLINNESLLCTLPLNH